MIFERINQPINHSVTRYEQCSPLICCVDLLDRLEDLECESNQFDSNLKVLFHFCRL